MAGERVAVYNGTRGHSVGRCGVTHGLLCAALPKYIRRCEVAKAVRVAVEFDRFASTQGSSAGLAAPRW